MLLRKESYFDIYLEQTYVTINNKMKIHLKREHIQIERCDTLRIE